MPVAGLAFYDLGSNSTRFLIVDPVAGDGEGFSPDGVVDRGARVTRLGSGVAVTEKLQPDAIGRVLEALRDFNDRVQSQDGQWVGGIATSACRRAENSTELFKKVRKVTGVAPELIAGDREGQLTARGVRASFKKRDSYRIMDIGGGSTEWIVDSGEQVKAESFDVGVVTLYERCVDGNRWRTEYDLCVREQLERSFVPETTGDGPLVLVGGTGTTMAACRLNLDTYSPERVHGYRLTDADINGLRQQFAGENFQHLSKRPMISKGRAEVLMPGLNILEHARQLTGKPKTLVSDFGILAGLADNFTRKDKRYVT